jgi:hypothetical protein
MYVRVGSGVAGPVCRRVWMECPGETRLSGIAWVWVGVCGGSAPLERCVEMLLMVLRCVCQDLLHCQLYKSFVLHACFRLTGL